MSHGGLGSFVERSVGPPKPVTNARVRFSKRFADSDLPSPARPLPESDPISSRRVSAPLNRQHQEHIGCADPFRSSVGFRQRYGDEEISQFRGAELIAERWGISRNDMERFAVRSHTRALEAQRLGRFDREILPVNGVEADEGPRPPDLEKIRSLPALRPGGRLTAAVSSPTSDGAAALLVCSENAISKYGFVPRARMHHLSCRGDDPRLVLTAPIPATRHALNQTALSVDDIDLFEVNEAFAPVVLAWQEELAADPERVNLNGGAIALGHPLGATGARIMTSLLHELERVNGRFGLQVMCEGGGLANVTVIERLP